MSKNGKTGPAMVRAKDGYAFSVNGRNVVLQPNELYPANHPVVLARPSLFERDDEAATSPELQRLLALADVRAVPDPKKIADETAAASRLQAVRGELAALRKPLPKPRGNGTVDVNDLTAKAAERNARRQVLETMLPGLEREALLAKLHSCEAVVAIEGLAYEQASEAFRAIERVSERALADVGTARVVAAQAFQRLQACQRQAEAASAAIAQLDARAGFVDEDETAMVRLPAAHLIPD